MEEVVQNKKIEVIQKNSRGKLFRNGCILLLAITVGYLHYRYVSQLHENYYHFSHLSDLERELTLKTEMGFYYSYYKTIVEEKPFIGAISKLMYDRLVEYPNEVNAFNRFNIHPEVLIGALYRYTEPLLNTSFPNCRDIHRGAGRAPVSSCVGLQVPIYFYLEAVWVLAGLLLATVFLHGATLSGTLLGGALAAAQYLANHSEATRVSRSPNERENMAFPLLLLQGWLLTTQLRSKSANTYLQLQISIFIVNCLCLLFWQLSQFVFLTQTAIFFLMEQLRIISLRTLCVFLHSHFCGLHLAILLLQGNDMLKSSLYTSFFLVISAYCLMFSSFRIKVKTRLDFFVESWLVLLRIAIAVLSSMYLKKLISDFLGAEDDNHIWDLLLSKFTNFKSFHTMMYTCIDVFDFLPVSYLFNVTKSLLLPLALYTALYYTLFWLTTAKEDTVKYFYSKNCGDKEKDVKTKRDKNRDEKTKKDKSKNKEESDSDSGIENNSDSVKKDVLKIPDSDETNKKIKDTVEDQITKKDVPKRLDLDELNKDLKENAENEQTDSVLVYFTSVLNVDAAVFYNVSQMAVFAVMAILFMRLKMLLTTQMCIVSSLAVNANVPFGCDRRVARALLWGAVAAIVARELYYNVSEELAFQGEFSDFETEELVEWFARSAGVGAVVGSMPVSAALMLAARRPIVSHPHYENKEARSRALGVHMAYGRFTAQQLYEQLTELKATYLVVEAPLCYGRTTQGCTILDIWDAERPSGKPRPQLCRALLADGADHLYRVFANTHYTVFRVHDLSVRYMPRVFDT